MSKFTGGYRRPEPGGRAYVSLVNEEEELNRELGPDSIGYLGLSSKVFMTLWRKGRTDGDFLRISHLRELLKTDRGRAILLGVPGLGEKTVAEIERQVAAYRPQKKGLRRFLPW